MERAVLAAVTLALVGLALGYLLGASSGHPTTTTTTLVVHETRTVASPTTTTVTVTSTAVRTVTVTATTTTTSVERVVVREGFPRFLVDALGRNVTIPEPPRRVASLSPAVTETLWALGALDRLVAVDHSSDYPPIIVEWRREGRVVDVGGYWWSTINLEKLVEAKPDLVIAEVGAHAKLLDAFEKYGLNVLYVRGGAARSLEDVYTDVWMVGYALGLEKRAAAWIEAMRRNVTLVSERLREANVTPVDVLVVLWWSPQGVWSTGGGTFLADMVSRAGGRLVTSRYSGWVQLSLEELASYKPGLILYTGMAGADRNQTLSVLREMAGSEPIRSMLESGARLCGLYGDAVNLVLRPGPRAAMGVQLLAAILHPDVFGGLPGGVVCLGG